MNESSRTDRDNRLLDRLKQGDENALKEIVGIYYVPLCVYSVRFTENEQESEDIVQDLFIRIWEKRLYEKISNLRMYLFISVHNLSIAYAKSHMIHDALEDIESKETNPWDEGLTEEEISGRIQALRDSLKKLSPKEHKILFRIIIDEQKYKDVADEMGISVNTVKIHLKRAMQKLRNKNLLFFIYFY